MKAKKVINHRHYVAVATLILTALLSIPLWDTILRLVETVTDFVLSFAYYFDMLINFGGTTTVQPTVNNLSQAITIDSILPMSFDRLEQLFTYWGQAIIDTANMSGYFMIIAAILLLAVPVLLIVLPCLIATWLICKKIALLPNNKPACSDSRLLQLHRKLQRKVYYPTVRYIQSFATFVKQHKAYYIIWLIIFCIISNIASIVLAILSYLLYVIASFDISQLYLQVYKLSIDLTYMLTAMPLLIWMVVAFLIIRHLCCKRAIKKLNNFEEKNRQFISEQDIVLFFVGTMGKGKTTLMTDIAQSLEVMYRDKALELLADNANKFPNFTWRNFETAIEKLVEHKQITTLHSAKQYVNNCKAAFENNPAVDRIWGYDFTLYPLQYTSQLKVESIWDVLISYAKLYIIYYLDTSLIISNYSIRTDGERESTGHFPSWDYDFVSKPPAPLKGNYSHILDYDTLRLGKTMNKANMKNNNEWGIICCTEIAKERGNKNTNAGLSNQDINCNTKNDYFNMSMSYKRHTSTIDGFPFARMLNDDQRPDRLEADALQMMTVITVSDKSKLTLSLPMFWMYELLHDLLYTKLKEFYYKIRKVRSDNTLFSYLLNRLQSSIHNFYNKVYQKYGYYTATIHVADGMNVATNSKHQYYLSTKKVYSKRFATDCYTELLNKHAATSTALQDISTYQDVVPTISEFEQQNSRVIHDMKKFGQDTTATN